MTVSLQLQITHEVFRAYANSSLQLSTELSVKKSKSTLLYDSLFTAKQFVLASRPLRPTTRGIFQLNLCGNSPYVTSSLKKRWFCLLWIRLAFRQVYVSQIKRVIENSSYCSTHKSSVSTCFAEQTMPILRVLCYNGNLVTWTVVSLTTAKFKPLMFSLSGFSLFYIANMFILMNLYDFCLLPTQFYYI
jgi:hypothetical protein